MICECAGPPRKGWQGLSLPFSQAWSCTHQIYSMRHCVYVSQVC